VVKRTNRGKSQELRPVEELQPDHNILSVDLEKKGKKKANGLGTHGLEGAAKGEKEWSGVQT